MRSTALGSWAAAIVLVFAASLIVPTASATIIYVPGVEPTIAAGIAAASPGDTVMIECGTYHENGLVIASGITLTSETGNWDCVSIDGDATDTILTLADASGAVVRGISFENGAALFAAGVYVDSCDVAFRDCRFYNNTAEVEAGGLRYWYGNPDIQDCDFIVNNAGDRGGNLSLRSTGGTVSNCEFAGGMAEWGGGVSVRSETTTEFQFCTFSGNYAPSDEGYGGGLYCGNGAAPLIQWCTFYQNTSDFCGGGVASEGNCAPVFLDCTFTENIAQWGGGLFARDPLAGTVNNSYFTGNEAQGGGGAFLEGTGSYSFNECWFESNVASEAGGGVLFESCSDGAGAFVCTFTGNTALYGGGIAAHDCTMPTLAANCTLVLNQVSGQRGAGGGIAISGGTPTEIQRCIVAFGESGEAVFCEEGAVVTAQECVVSNNSGGDWVGCLSGQETLLDNSDDDPNFCGVFDWNYSLCEDSYCLPGNNTPGVNIGAHDVGCDACDSPVEMTSWGGIKALYR